MVKTRRLVISFSLSEISRIEGLMGLIEYKLPFEWAVLAPSLVAGKVCLVIKLKGGFYVSAVRRVLEGIFVDFPFEVERVSSFSSFFYFLLRKNRFFSIHSFKFFGNMDKYRLVKMISSSSGANHNFYHFVLCVFGGNRVTPHRLWFSLVSSFSLPLIKIVFGGKLKDSTYGDGYILAISFGMEKPGICLRGDNDWRNYRVVNIGLKKGNYRDCFQYVLSSFCFRHLYVTPLPSRSACLREVYRRALLSSLFDGGYGRHPNHALISYGYKRWGAEVELMKDFDF